MSSAMAANSTLPIDPYAELPEGIHLTHSRAEYLWLTDAQKARLIESETEPEITDDCC